MKALMKYPGSKRGSADWIISHFPEHHSYLEPFFGSGGVFFNKPRSDIETINDLDGEVINLFRQIRNDPERLAREIYFTPYSREAYEMAYQKEPENDLEKAVLFYTRLNMGHGFRTQGEKVGWKLDVQGREKGLRGRGLVQDTGKDNGSSGAPAGRTNREPPGGRSDPEVQF